MPIECVVDPDRARAREKQLEPRIALPTAVFGQLLESLGLLVYHGVLGIDALACPDCAGGRLKLICAF